MSHFNEADIVRDAAGRFAGRHPAAPAAHLPEPTTAVLRTPAAVEARDLEASRERVREALDAVVAAEVTHVEARARSILRRFPGDVHASLRNLGGNRIVLTEIWDARTWDVVSDEQRPIKASQLALDHTSGYGWEYLHTISKDGPTESQAARAVSQARAEYVQSSARMVDDVLAMADQHGAVTVDFKTRDGDRAGAVTISGAVLTLDDGTQVRVAGAGEAWDSFRQIIAQNVDPSALEGLPRNPHGGIDMPAWRRSTGRDQVDGQVYAVVNEHPAST